jgi:hypothetical protein
MNIVSNIPLRISAHIRSPEVYGASETDPGTYLQRKKTKRAGMKPAWSRVKQNTIFVLPGPGKP